MMTEQPPTGYRWSNVMLLLLPEPQQIIPSEQAPAWPRQIETFWRPIPGGPDYTLVGTTRAVSVTVGHFTVEDTREITVRVLGSKQRRVNDWKNWRLCLRGKALHPKALPFQTSSDSLVVFAWGKSPLVIMNVAMVGIRHISTPSVWGQSDFTRAEPNYQTISINHEATETEKRRAERGKKLLARFVSTMTARGRPESGESDEKRQATARERLTVAAHELLHDDLPTSITIINMLNALTGVTTERGAYVMLDRANWQIDDVQEAANSVHMACRNGR